MALEINLIYGPPGTGKTTELLRLLEEALKTYAPSQIAYVSFTKEGVDQGKWRAIEKFSLSDEDFPYFRTLHSMAFKECRLNRGSVMSKENYAHFSRKVGMNFTGYYTEDFRNNDDMYLFFDEVYRNTPKTAELYLETLDIDKLKFVRKSYAAYKKQFALYDFTDMVEMYVEGNNAIPVKIAFIDEAQDLTTLQWRMVWTAFRNCDRIYIAGDDDQAIYQWSGADVNYFLALEGNVTILRNSHRVPDSIKEYSSSITSQITKRVDKKYHGTGEQGLISYSNNIESLKFNPKETYMLLSRNTCFLAPIVERLRQKGLIYTYRNEPSVKAQDVKAIGLYERVRKAGSMSDEEEKKLKPLLNKNFALIDPWYLSMNFKPEYSSYLRQVIKNKPATLIPQIRVSTIHSVKGGEADNVVLLMDMTKSTYANLQRNPDSEHRVFYVGVTRAKKSLTLVYPSSKTSYPMPLLANTRRRK